MDTLESTTQSFIVKVWVEEIAEEPGQGVWHGHITHALSGERHYLKNLDEVRDFIAPYLEDMGVKPETRRRTKRWLRQLIGKG
jgi:hypothetical protein